MLILGRWAAALLVLSLSASSYANRPWGRAAASRVSPTNQVYFPADNNPADGVISEEEYLAYVQAWLNHEEWAEHDGGQVPIDFVSRAAYLRWKHNGHYQVTGNGSTATSYGSTSISIGFSSSNLFLVGAPDPYEPASVTVYLDTPEEEWNAVAVEERVPLKWPVDILSTDPYSKSDLMPRTGLSIVQVGDEWVVRWAPVEPSDNGNFVYQLRVPIGQLPISTPMSWEGFSGVQSYDGVSRPSTYRYLDPGAFNAEGWLYANTSRPYSWGWAIGEVTEQEASRRISALAFGGNHRVEALSRFMPVFSWQEGADGRWKVVVEYSLHRQAVRDELLSVEFRGGASLGATLQPILPTSVAVVSEPTGSRLTHYRAELEVPEGWQYFRLVPILDRRVADELRYW